MMKKIDSISAPVPSAFLADGHDAIYREINISGIRNLFLARRVDQKRIDFVVSPGLPPHVWIYVYVSTSGQPTRVAARATHARKIAHEVVKSLKTLCALENQSQSLNAWVFDGSVTNATPR